MVEKSNSRVMKGNYIKYLLLCFLQLALLSCIKETPENPAVESGNTILYSATVSQSPLTRVALSGSEFADGCYVFESGDKLYVEYRDGETLKLYGVLTLVSGAGSGTGRFEGELKCLDAFVPEDNTLLNATVVGANAAEGFFSFGNPTDDPAVDPGSIVTGVTYPSSVSYAPLPEMVQKYSYFTGTSTYDAKNFNNLTQQSVFLLFKLANFRRNGLANKVNLLLKNGTSTLHTVTEVPIGNSSYYGNVNCSTAVQAGDVLAGAKIQLDDNLEDSNVPMEFEQGLSNVLNLEANHYYSVSRILDSFRIKATVSGTTTMTFRYTDGSIEYSEDKGETWYTYTGKTFNLSAGDDVWFRGNRIDCNCIGGDQLFTADQVCYIAGDITSLIGYKSTLPTDAFRSAFSYGDLSDKNAEGMEKNLPMSPGTVNWVDIDPKDPLILPASTAANCYMEMFLGCTSLHSAPDLPATVLEDKCYLRMFCNCTGLRSIPTFSSQVTMSGTSNRRRYCFQMFQGCTGITSLTGSLFEETTELKANCFEDMFANCTGLTSVSAGFLPSTRLAAHCYRGMFQNTRFPSAPDLLATKLVTECYRYMFNGCTQLTYIKCLATENIGNGYTTNWVGGSVPNNEKCKFVRASSSVSWPQGANGVLSKWTFENAE